MSSWQQNQLERQAQFWAQIRQGKTNTAACEAVGWNGIKVIGGGRLLAG